MVGLGAVRTFNGLDVASGGANGGNCRGAEQKKKDEAAAAGGAGLPRFDWARSGGVGAVVEFDAVGFSFRDYFRVIAINDFERATARSDFERAAVVDRDFTERWHRSGGADECTVGGDEEILVGRERKGD